MIVRNIIKTDNILTVSPNDYLSSALSKLTTSHDAAFVFSDEKQFLGVINPYFSVIKTSYPGNAKVMHCMTHPPKVYLNYKAGKVAQLLTESKVHYLPVYDDKEVFAGIISARRLLTSFRDSPIFNIPLNQLLQSKQRVVTILEEDSLSKALNLFKSSKLSKLVVVDKEGRLKGVLSYYDLISYLIAPKSKERRGEKEGTKDHFQSLQVKRLCKTYVLTLTPENTMTEALGLILDKKIGSVIVVDHKRIPLIVVTTTEFLKMLRKDGLAKPVELTTKHISNENRPVLGGFFNSISVMIKKIPGLAGAKIVVKEEKNNKLFQVFLSLFPNRGKSEVIKIEGKDLRQVFVDVKNKVKRRFVV
ncbi:MAG: CBS domain-containing protein [Candidatus Roizmanbacteria bacterium]